MAKQKGVEPENLYKIPPVNGGLEYLFNYWHEAKGEGRLTWAELEAWDRLNGYDLNPEEFRLVFVIDETFCKVQNEYQRKQSENLTNGNK